MSEELITVGNKSPVMTVFELNQEGLTFVNLPYTLF